MPTHSRFHGAPNSLSLCASPSICQNACPYVHSSPTHRGTGLWSSPGAASTTSQEPVPMNTRGSFALSVSALCGSRPDLCGISARGDLREEVADTIFCK